MLLMCIFRGRQLKVAGDRTFEPWTATIINDTDFNVRNQWKDGRMVLIITKQILV